MDVDLAWVSVFDGHVCGCVVLELGKWLLFYWIANSYRSHGWLLFVRSGSLVHIVALDREPEPPVQGTNACCPAIWRVDAT